MENKDYEQGYQDGFKAGQKSMHERIKELNEMLEALRDYNDQLLIELQSVRGIYGI